MEKEETSESPNKNNNQDHEYYGKIFVFSGFRD